jgi:hypothetical protein
MMYQAEYAVLILYGFGPVCPEKLGVQDGGDTVFRRSPGENLRAGNTVF